MNATAQQAYNDTLWKREIYIGIDFRNPANISIREVPVLLTEAVNNKKINVYENEKLKKIIPNDMFLGNLGQEESIIDDYEIDEYGNQIPIQYTVISDPNPNKIISIIFMVNVSYTMHKGQINYDIIAANPIAVSNESRGTVTKVGWLAYREIMPILQLNRVKNNNLISHLTLHDYVYLKISRYEDYVFQINSASGEAIWKETGAKGPFNPNINTLMKEVQTKLMLIKTEHNIYKY